MVSSTPDQQLHQRESDYSKYKRLEIKIFVVLDPEGLLRCVKLLSAKKIIKELVGKLDENLRDTVSAQVLEAIALRKEWAKRYKWAPWQMQVGHEKYIDFLTSIHQHLSAFRDSTATSLDIAEQQLEEDKFTDDDETDLTPDQADFLAFLESLMTIAREAAGLFKEVAQGKLSMWTASTLSNVLLREAENLIHVTELLNGEDLLDRMESKPPRIWAATTRLLNGRTAGPQLAQDWVDTLNKARDTGPTMWVELATLLPEIWRYIESFVLPSLNSAAGVFTSGHQPYAFRMLRHGYSRNLTLTSVAQVPLVTLVGAYFCRLVMSKDADGEWTPAKLDAAREAACAEMNENLAVLPRLLRQNALTKKQVDEFRSMTGQMKQWAKACFEPMSLGAVHTFTRTHWISWHVCIIGSNSVPLQIFLYQCEKRRLQFSEDMTGSSEYERLVGALLEDKRIAPHLLMKGRPKTVLQCITALQHWCHLPTLDGDTLDDSLANLTLKHTKAIENSSIARNINSLHMDIAENDYCVTNKIYARVLKNDRKQGSADGTALKRYLDWEMGAPSCLKLEIALFKAIQNTPEWEDLLVAALLSVVRAESGWLTALFNVLKSGMKALTELRTSSSSCGCILLKESLQIATLKMALKVPGYEESLKAALIDAVQATPGWQDSFADNLLRNTMAEWQKISQTFNVEALSRSLRVHSLACIRYLLRQDKDRDTKNETRNQVVEKVLEGFMVNARPILEEAYSKNHNVTNDDIAG